MDLKPFTRKDSFGHATGELAVSRAVTIDWGSSTVGDPGHVERWRTVTAAARLSENIPAETRHLAKLVRSGLADA